MAQLRPISWRCSTSAPLHRQMQPCTVMRSCKRTPRGDLQPASCSSTGAPDPALTGTASQAPVPEQPEDSIWDQFKLRYADRQWLPRSDSGAAAGLGPSSEAAARNTKPGGLPARAIGVDYGTVWTGLALSEFGINQPLKVLRNERNMGLTARQVVDAALQHNAGGIVVGLPVQSRGTLSDPDTDSNHGSRCRAFAHTLSLMSRKHGIDIYLFNERKTTSAAMYQIDVPRKVHDNMGRKAKNAKKVDAWSAAMTLAMFYKHPRSALRVRLRTNLNAVTNFTVDEGGDGGSSSKAAGVAGLRSSGTEDDRRKTPTPAAAAAAEPSQTRSRRARQPQAGLPDKGPGASVEAAAPGPAKTAADTNSSGAGAEAAQEAADSKASGEAVAKPSAKRGRPAASARAAAAAAEVEEGHEAQQEAAKRASTAAGGMAAAGSEKAPAASGKTAAASGKTAASKKASATSGGTTTTRGRRTSTAAAAAGEQEVTQHARPASSTGGRRRTSEAATLLEKAHIDPSAAAASAGVRTRRQSTTSEQPYAAEAGVAVAAFTVGAAQPAASGARRGSGRAASAGRRSSVGAAA